MRIYGIRLPHSRFVHEDDYPYCEDEFEIINPERDYSSACHLYWDLDGYQYIGFELSLGMNAEEMKTLLGKCGKIYKVLS